MLEIIHNPRKEADFLTVTSYPDHLPPLGLNFRVVEKFCSTYTDTVHDDVIRRFDLDKKIIIDINPISPKFIYLEPPT